MAKEDLYAALGRRMAARRAELGLSQAEVARRLGIAQTTYSGYENGSRKLPLDALLPVCRVLETQPLLLLEGENAPGPLSPGERGVIEALRRCPCPEEAARAVRTLLQLSAQDA